ncbi:MAG: ribosome biogenesis GTPase YlqF [Aerococcus sp.]|nr:ribosome biogenesis GTPase YlqF [Aerococcus sp.]
MAIIQWYPGHMEKAKREVQSQLSAVDIVIELRDARVPQSSENPMINKLINQKKHLIVLNKADLADPKATEQWLKYLKYHQGAAIAIDSKNNRDMKRLREAIKALARPIVEKWQQKGVKQKTIRLMVLGIPNVGKSTFINQLTRKKIASVGNRPGVTKGQQWIRIDEDFELLDTPGILWPKFEDQRVAERLALIGSIKDDHYYSDDILLVTLDILKTHYPEAFMAAFKLKEADMELSLPDLLLLLTKKMGLKDDYEQASDQLIQSLQKGKLGRFTFDWISDFEEETDGGSEHDE